MDITRYPDVAKKYVCLFHKQNNLQDFNHFLENRGMSGNSVLTGMPGNYQGILLFVRELTFLLFLLMKH